MYRSILVLLLLTGCGNSACPGGAVRPMRIYDLYFGRSVAGRGEVTDKEWRDFRDQVITPALPDGYTVLDGQGAWMNPRSRATIAEATKILEVALPDALESQTVVNRIRNAWQRRFHQYVVGMTVVSGCGSFSPSEAPNDR
jgi:Asp-tRNA(Asn)/Glu-tRNA(Gln) amidotransferase A subunit family amidase